MSFISIFPIPKIHRTHLTQDAGEGTAEGEVRSAQRVELPLVISGMDHLQLRTQQQTPKLLVVKHTHGIIDPGQVLRKRWNNQIQ